MGPLASLLGSLFKTRAPLRAAARRAGSKAAREVRAEAIAKADAAGLRGAERAAFKAGFEPGAAAARSVATNRYANLLPGVGSDAGKSLPRAVLSRVSDLLDAGDLDGAEREAVSAIKRAVTREAYDIRKGRRATTALDLSFTGSTDDVVSEVVSHMEQGLSLQEASRESLARFAVLKRDGLPDVVGRQAYEAGVLAKRASDSYSEAFDILNRTPRAQDRIMAKYFQRDEDGNWVDTQGRVWEPEDLQSYSAQWRYDTDDQGNQFRTEVAQSFDPKHTRTTDPREPYRGAVLSVSVGDKYERMVSNFIKSMTSSGMAHGSPRVYNDIVATVRAMSPGRMLKLVRDGTIRKQLVWYFSSDQSVITSRLGELLRNLGMDPNNYDSEELTW